MKRNIPLLLCFLLVLSLCACGRDRTVIAEAPIESAAQPAAAVGRDIPFRYLHRGFTAIQQNDWASFEAFSAVGTKVIFSDEDWHDYMDRFCPGIPYFDSVDFSKECLLAAVSFGARPAYNQAKTLTRLSVADGNFVFEYEEDPTACLALNSSGTTQFYVQVLIIPREALPEVPEALTYRPAPGPSTMEEILAREGSFYHEGTYMTLEEFCADDWRPAAFTQIAAADLSQDGTDEILLWLSGEEEVVSPFSEPYKEGVLVLHQEDGLVHGDFMEYYDLYDLKADGTFRWCGKHGSSGVAFADARYGFWCRNPIATEEKKDYSSPDDTMICHADRAAYGLDDSLSDEEAYRRAMEIQSAKEEAHWFPFPGTSLDDILK